MSVSPSQILNTGFVISNMGLLEEVLWEFVSF